VISERGKVFETTAFTQPPHPNDITGFSFWKMGNANENPPDGVIERVQGMGRKGDAFGSAAGG
jgi:hypothetical protein